MPAVRIANGLKLFYREAGSGDRVVLLVHGNTASSVWYERVMERLPAGIRAIAPDLRGCGDTDHPDGEWSMAQLAEDLYQLTQTLGLTRFAVAGHSLGGSVALQLTVAHPESVSHLVLVNSAPADGLQTPPERYAQLEAMIKMPEVLKQVLTLMAPTAPQDEFLARVLEESVTKSATALVRNGRALELLDLVEQARSVTAPVLVLYGKMDGLITLEMAERLHRQIPGSVLEVWEGVGHSAIVEVPDRFAQRLAAFINA